MMQRILFVFSFFVFAFSSNAQDLSQYQKKWFINGIDTLPYRILLPQNFDAAKEYPLILVLHGAGERGRDNEAQLVHGAKLFLRDDVRANYPAIVVFPQCPQESYWSNVQFVTDKEGKRSFHFQQDGAPTKPLALVQQLLKQLDDTYKLDDDRMYVGGLSMGGMGTFELVRRNPKMFAAAFPICGGANPSTAKKLRKTAWWIFHGAKDDVVPPMHSQIMADALKKKKADVKLTIYPDANHNSWDSAFAEKDLFPWMFAHQR